MSFPITDVYFFYRYTLKKFEKSSTMRKQVFEEQDKLMKLVDGKTSPNSKQSTQDTNQQSEETEGLENITLSNGSVQDMVKTLKSKNKEDTLKTADGLQKNINLDNSRKRKPEETNNVGFHIPPQPKRKKGATKAKVYLRLLLFYFINSSYQFMVVTIKILLILWFYSNSYYLLFKEGFELWCLRPSRIQSILINRMGCFN